MFAGFFFCYKIFREFFEGNSVDLPPHQDTVRRDAVHI